MDAKAKKLIDLVLQWEGGYSDPSYDGHETYCGITRKNHPKWDGWKVVDSYKPLKYNQKIKNASLEQSVRNFYYENYYLKMKINLINDLLTSGQLFAMGVNAGTKTAIKLLQKAINKVYNTAIAVDGVIGEITLNYTNSNKSKMVAQEMINQCNAYYDSLVVKNSKNKKFLNGWKNRVKGVTSACSSSNVLLTNISTDSIWNWLLKIFLGIIKMFKK